MSRGPVGQHRDRGVGAHRPDRLGAGAGHRAEEDTQFLFGVAEHPLPRSRSPPRTAGGSRGGRSFSVDLARVRRISSFRCCSASPPSTSSSSTIRPVPVSARKIRPGCSRPLRTTVAGSMSSTPTSLARGMTRPSRVIQYRPGRGPLRVQRHADHPPVGERDQGGSVHGSIIGDRGTCRRPGGPGPSPGRFCHGSGIIAPAPRAAATGRHVQQFEALVELAESLPAGSSAGDPVDAAPVGGCGIRLLASVASRARSSSVTADGVDLAVVRGVEFKGARAARTGNVSVENREWTMASADQYRSSDRSGRRAGPGVATASPCPRWSATTGSRGALPLCRRARLRRRTPSTPAPSRAAGQRQGQEGLREVGLSARAPRPRPPGGRDVAPAGRQVLGLGEPGDGRLASPRPAVSLSRTPPAA